MTRVYSVQSAILGNQVYSERLTAFMQAQPRLTFERAWSLEDRTLAGRLAYRAVDLRVPSAAVAARNADLRRARNEIATSLLARSLVGRRLRWRPRPDVLHFHTQVLALSALHYVRRIPTVLTTDATAVNYQDDDPPGRQWTHAPSLWMERRLFRAAWRIVLFSEWARRAAVRRYGLDPARTAVIPPGVPTARFPERLEPRVAGPLRVLFVGNSLARKGGYDLAEVCAAMTPARCALTVITSDPLPPAFPAVVLRGVQPYTDPWFAAYAAADVLVLPAYAEPFGLVYLEAMAAGLPIVGSTVGAGPELIADGDTGMLVTPGDRQALARALDALHDHPARGRALGRAGRARARARYDEAVVFGQLADCFEAAGAASAGAAAG